MKKIALFALCLSLFAVSASAETIQFAIRKTDINTVLVRRAVGNLTYSYFAANENVDNYLYSLSIDPANADPAKRFVCEATVGKAGVQGFFPIYAISNCR